MSEKIAICCVVDNTPQFHREFLIWHECVLANCDNQWERFVYFVGGCPNEIKQICDRNNTNYQEVETLLPLSPHCNKIIPFFKNWDDYSYVIVTDTDLYILKKDISSFFSKGSGQIKAAPNNENNPPLHIFQKLFAKLGTIDFVRPGISLFTGENGSRESYINNHSGGIVAIEGRLTNVIAEKWLSYAKWLIENRYILYSWKVHVDQVSLALSLEELGYDITFLPPQVNTVLRLTEEVSEIVALHLSQNHLNQAPEYSNADGTLSLKHFPKAHWQTITRLNLILEYVEQQMKDLLLFQHSIISSNGQCSNTYLSISDDFKSPDIDNNIDTIIAEIEKSGLFDEQFYLESNLDVKEANISAIWHYVVHGEKENRLPNNWFKPQYFKSRILSQKGKDLPEVNALYEYIAGNYAGFDNSSDSYSSDQKINMSESQNHFEGEQTILNGNPSARAIAFYLPQFHEIPENNEWWGEGFTEWTHVKPAKPQFPNHDQPREPLNKVLGYYTLDNDKVLMKQAEIAKKSGIEGFAFYYYNFGSKTLLETPLQRMLNNKEIQQNYCIFWANHPWTTGWYGKAREVLIDIPYSRDFYSQFIKDIEAYLKDERYIKVNGKPVIMILHPCGGDGPPTPEDTTLMLELWRKHCKEVGIGEIYIMASTLSYDTSKASEYKQLGFDACFEFSPTAELNGGILNSTDLISHYENSNFASDGTLLLYEDMMKRRQLFRDLQSDPIYPCVVTNWDNTPRYGSKGVVFHGGTPDVYTKALTDAIQHIKQHFDNPEHQLLFLNGWNEWSEGTYLEPDKKYGYAYLNAITKALS